MKAAAEPHSEAGSDALLPLGTRVRFLQETAPNAHKRFGAQVATVVTRNHRDREMGLTFGWSGKRSDEAMRWSGDEALIWATLDELEVVA